MAITPISKYSDSSGATGEQTHSTGSISYTTGRRILAIVNGQRDNHTAGLEGNWALPSDDAVTNSITWTELGQSSLDTLQGASFGTDTVVWYSSELTATESFDIEFDANGSGTESFFYDVQVVELENWTGGTEQALQFEFAEADNESITFASAPTSGDFQLCAILFQNDGTVTGWDAVATNFAVLSGSQHDTQGSSRVITSTTNTAATVADGVATGGGTFFNAHMVGMVLTEDVGTPAFDQEGYRFGEDDGTESAHGWAAAQDTAITSGSAQLLRTVIDETGGAGASRTLKLQYRRDDEAASEWRDVE